MPAQTRSRAKQESMASRRTEMYSHSQNQRRRSGKETPSPRRIVSLEDDDNEHCGSEDYCNSEHSGSGNSSLDMTYELDITGEDSPVKVPKKYPAIDPDSLGKFHTSDTYGQQSMRPTNAILHRKYNKIDRGRRAFGNKGMPEHASEVYSPIGCNPSGNHSGSAYRSQHISKKHLGEPAWFSTCFTPLCIICALVAFSVVYVYIQPIFWMEKHLKPLGYHERLFKTYEGHLMKLMDEFPHQDAMLWKKVKAASKSVLKSANPMQPAVILMASTNQASHTTKCLANKLADIVSSVYNLTGPSRIDGEDFLNHKSTMAKEKLDQLLHNAFSQNKAAVLHSLHQIPAESSLILHSYCDNDHAPYKDVVIILTLPMMPQDQRVDDATVEQYLESVWREKIDNDKMGALLSRIANNIVEVREEKQTKC